MTQLHFTINGEEIQKIINESAKDNAAKTVLTIMFNSHMEEERDQYLKNESYQRDPDRKSYRNGYYEREYTTKIGTLTLRVPRTRDGKFYTDLFEKI